MRRRSGRERVWPSGAVRVGRRWRARGIVEILVRSSLVPSSVFPFVVSQSSSLVPLLAILITVFTACSEPPATRAQHPRSNASVQALASLIDPAKLDTLKSDRAANPRLRKACYWLHVA